MEKDVVRRQVILHEIGHTFGLQDIVRSEEEQTISFGVMTQAVNTDERLLPIYQVFQDYELILIQACEYPN